MDLRQKLQAVLSHLNSEENEMALEFAEQLNEFIEESQEQAQWLACLESAGVDNWSGYDYARELYREAVGEDE